MKHAIHFAPFLCMLLLTFASCQTPVQQAITVSDYVTYRRTRRFEAPIVQTSNPGEAYATIFRSLYREALYQNDHPFGVGNYMIQTWPDDRRTSVAAFNLSWLALFMTEQPQPGTTRFLDAYESNLLAFARARYYAEVAARTGQRQDAFYVERADQLQSIVDRGYQRQHVLVDFLAAQQNALVRVYLYRDIRYARLALEQLQDIRVRHPQWLPEIIDAQMAELQEVVQRND